MPILKCTIQFLSFDSEVYFMQDNRIQHGYVDQYKMIHFKSGQPYVEYELRWLDPDDYEQRHVWFPSHQVFETKELLIESLIKLSL
jgi:hypothetical protein